MSFDSDRHRQATRLASNVVELPASTRDLHGAVFATVRRLMAADGRSNPELARAASCSKSTLVKWEVGRVTTPRLDVMCRVLNALGYRLEITPI